MVIAIDGPAGSGKSTIAKMLAENLIGPDNNEFIYINSGYLYRALTLGCLQAGINVFDSEKVLEFSRNCKLEYQKDRIFLDGIDVSDKLHTDEIDRFSAPLSAIVPVRHLVNNFIQEIAGNRNIVVEGRDMTTVVFPSAEYRFYLDASAETRAKRRYEQGVSRLSYDEILNAILKRDHIDKNKKEGSLILSPGVEYIDSSDLTLIEVYDKLVYIVNRKIRN